MMRPDLELVAMRESDYYAALASFFAPIRAVVWITASLIVLGGILGGLNTMYAAFVSRVREFGTLQAIGFRRRAILLSLVQESTVATVAGTLIACAIGVLLLDGIAVRFSLGAFGLIVDTFVLALSLDSRALRLACSARSRRRFAVFVFRFLLHSNQSEISATRRTQSGREFHMHRFFLRTCSSAICTYAGDFFSYQAAHAKRPARVVPARSTSFDALEVGEAMKKAKVGEEIILRGRITDGNDVFVPNRAIFRLADESAVPSCCPRVVGGDCRATPHAACRPICGRRFSSLIRAAACCAPACRASTGWSSQRKSSSSARSIRPTTIACSSSTPRRCTCRRATFRLISC
jgi:hypothetical protein